MFSSRSLLALAAAGLCLTLLACRGAEPSRAAASPGATQDLLVHRGAFEQTALLTGEIEATQARNLSVPRTPSWRVDLRWIAEDGTPVKAGDRVAELDKSEFVQDLEDKELSLQEKLSELERKKAEVLDETRQKEFAVAKAEGERDKKKIDADLPEGIVPRQEMADRQLDLEKAETDLATARDELDTQKRSAAADIELQQIEIAKARREIEAARAAIDDLTIRAPEDGLFLVGDLPWEDRKLQVGDTVWAGLSLGSIPDLSSLRVAARLPDVDDGKIAPGMPARIVLDAYPDRVYQGSVSSVTPIAQEEGGESLRRFFRVQVALDASDPEHMIPGMSARVEVVRDTVENALLAPRTCLDLRLPVPDEGETPTGGAGAAGAGEDAGPATRARLASGQARPGAPRPLQRPGVRGGGRGGRGDPPGELGGPRRARRRTVGRRAARGRAVSDDRRKRLWTRRLIPSLIVAVVVAAAGLIGARAAAPDRPTAVVERGDLAVTVAVEGSVEAVDPITLTPPSVPGIWNYRISFMAPEGAAVHEGDRVLAFDTQELEQRLRQRVADRDSAAQQIEKRRTDLAKEREQVELQLAETRARLRKTKLELETPEELMAASELAQQKIDRDLAEKEIAHLEERLDLLARQAKAELGMLEERRAAAASRVDEIDRYTERMQLTAPRSGIVIYEADWRGEKPKLGDQVWPGRTILQIPDLSHLRGAGMVDESDLAAIAVGQPVTLRLDAHPDVRYHGHLARIARTVQRRSPDDPRKVVKVVIELNETDPERLRPGLRFQGEVEVESHQGVLSLPAAAVVSTAAGPTVYRATLFGQEAIHPKLGRVTPDRVEIVSGLSAGDRVLLEAPDTTGTESSAPESPGLGVGGGTW